MKNPLRQLGVTLLEIMLVLAIAAFIIVMSIRYYQSAQSSTAVNSIESAIAAIMATADNHGLSASGYSGLTGSGIASSLPGGSVVTPWGVLDSSMIQVTDANKDSYKATIALQNIPTGPCQQFIQFIKNVGKDHIEGTPTCTKSGGISWTYKLTASP